MKLILKICILCIKHLTIPLNLMIFGDQKICMIKQEIVKLRLSLQKIVKKSQNSQKKFAAFLNSLKGGNKTEEQRAKLDNLSKFYKDREDIIDSFDDSTTMASQARYKAIKKTKGKGIKILPPKQMLQRLSIAIGQVKAGDTSDNLLNQKKLFIPCIEQKKLLKN